MGRKHRERRAPRAGTPADAPEPAWDLGREAVRVSVACLAFAGVLVVLDTLLNFLMLVDNLSVRRVFNMTREESVPSWFSSLLAVLVGASAYVNARVHRARGGSGARRWGWMAIATFFVYMAADDAASIHERFGSWFDGVVGRPLPSYGWQFLLGPVFVAMGVFVAAFTWKPFRRTGLHAIVLLALGLYAAAMGLDFLEGKEGFYSGIAGNLGWETYTISHYGKVIEEFLEMAAPILLVYAFLRYLALVVDGTRLRLVRDAAVPGAGPRDA